MAVNKRLEVLDSFNENLNRFLWTSSIYWNSKTQKVECVSSEGNPRACQISKLTTKFSILAATITISTLLVQLIKPQIHMTFFQYYATFCILAGELFAMFSSYTCFTYRESATYSFNSLLLFYKTKGQLSHSNVSQSSHEAPI